MLKSITETDQSNSAESASDLQIPTQNGSEFEQVMVEKTDSYHQIIILSLICFACPGMFNALNGLGGGGQLDDRISSNANVALYSTFCLVSLFSSSITSVLGVKLSLFLGGASYVIYAGSLLNYNINSNAEIVIVCGALLGIGAAILWEVEGLMMLSYALENEKGIFISTFWIIFNLGILPIN